MSEITTCPQCGAKCKVRRSDSETSLKAVQDKDLLNKIKQLKIALAKSQKLVAQLEQQLKQAQA